jgi:gliding motility-associated-like protein
MSIFISAKDASSGRIEVGGRSIPFEVAANEVAEIPIDYNQAYINDREAGAVIRNKSIHIVVDAGQPRVAVFAFISASARSESYLVLPTSAMGQKYYAVSAQGRAAGTEQPNTVSGRHYIIIVATEPNTTVNVKKPGVPAQLVLLPAVGDMFELLEEQDVSAVEIEALNCKKIAVFSGHSGLGLTFATFPMSYDPLIQQLYPIESWGRTYGLVPFQNRNYFYKVVASEPNTIIMVDGEVKDTLNTGEVFIPQDVPITKPMLLTANRPVSVAQFAYSQSDLSADPERERLGDPDMVILNPEEYNINKVTLFASFNRTPEFYLNVFMKTLARSSFKINGAAPNGIWRPMPSNPLYSYIQISFSQFSLAEESLTLTADDGFNAIAYGFGEVESYAYSAGTNLAVNNFLQLTNVAANITAEDACVNEQLSVKVILPDEVSSLTWTFEEGSRNFTDVDPQANTIVNADGTSSYEYVYPKGLVLFNTTGVHRVQVEAAFVSGSNKCADPAGKMEYVYEFEITEPRIEVPTEIEILAGGKATIQATTNEVGLSYRWLPAAGLSDSGVLNPEVSVEQSTQYTLTATSPLGCVISRKVLVKVSDSFLTPNAFSPNGDGVNDTWNLRLLNTYLSARVEIFNRYGEKVFSSTGYPVPFDGTHNGKALPVGTYYYVIAPRNGKQNITGALTIIR